MAGYTSIVNRQLLPAFGQMALESITSAAIGPRLSQLEDRVSPTGELARAAHLYWAERGPGDWHLAVAVPIQAP